MSIAANGAAERLDIGQTLQDVLNVLTRSIAPFALMGVLLSGLPVALMGIGNFLAMKNAGFVLLTLLGLVASFVTRPILFGALIFGAVRALDGETISIGECLTAGQRRWGAMLALMIITGMLIGLGLVLLVVPGVYFALQWAVAGPALVLSGRGSLEARQESDKLTKGRRWSLLLFYLVVVMALVCAVGLLVMLESALTLVAPAIVVTVLLDPLSNVILDVSLAVTAAVLYRRLRGAVEGPRTAALAEVFA